MSVGAVGELLALVGYWLNEFLNLDTIDTGPVHSLLLRGWAMAGGGCPGHCRMLNSIPGLHPLEAPLPAHDN